MEQFLLGGLLVLGEEGAAQGIPQGGLEKLAQDGGHVQVGQLHGDRGGAGGPILLGGDHLPGEVAGHGPGQPGHVLQGQAQGFQILADLAEGLQILQGEAVGVPILGKGQHVPVPQGLQALFGGFLSGSSGAAGGQAQEKGQAQ